MTVHCALRGVLAHSLVTLFDLSVFHQYSGCCNQWQIMLCSQFPRRQGQLFALAGGTIR
jgi:hypothetical protein